MLSDRPSEPVDVSPDLTVDLKARNIAVDITHKRNCKTARACMHALNAYLVRNTDSGEVQVPSCSVF